MFYICFNREADDLVDGGIIVRTSGRLRPGVTHGDNIAVIACHPACRTFCARRLQCRSVWIVRSVFGAICALMTWGLIGYAQFVVVFVILVPSRDVVSSAVHGAVFGATVGLACVAHLKAMLTDPVGIVPSI